MLISAIKKQTSVCSSNSLNPDMVFLKLGNLEISWKKKEKRKAIPLF